MIPLLDLLEEVGLLLVLLVLDGIHRIFEDLYLLTLASQFRVLLLYLVLECIDFPIVLLLHFLDRLLLLLNHLKKIRRS